MEGRPNTEITKGVKIKIAQHNCRGSNDVFITLFHIIKGFDISFVYVQDLPLYRGDPLRATEYECILQKTAEVRVCTYVFESVCQNGRLVGQSWSIGIVNAYNR